MTATAEQPPRGPTVPDWPDWSHARPGARFTDWLRENAEPDWTAATTHRFTRELAAGTLDPDVMRRYLVQDYSFIDAFVRLLGAAVHAAPALADRIPMGRFLGMIVSDENTYFVRAMDALGIAEAERTRPALRPPTRAFQSLMTEAAGSGRYAEMLAVLVVAEWSYLAWASAVQHADPPQFWSREWIALHANPYFAGFVGWLRGQLDREGPALDAAARGRVLAHFRAAAALERAFFDETYKA
ncbi:MAG: TenA family protein [Alphaproteobacteria bacterium]|nr:TenA family protein [Alphaproteobacteria bacterium]